MAIAYMRYVLDIHEHELIQWKQRDNAEYEDTVRHMTRIMEAPFDRNGLGFQSLSEQCCKAAYAGAVANAQYSHSYA